MRRHTPWLPSSRARSCVKRLGRALQKWLQVAARGGGRGAAGGVLNSDSHSFAATFKLLSGRFCLKNTIYVKMAEFWL